MSLHAQNWDEIFSKDLPSIAKFKNSHTNTITKELQKIYEIDPMIAENYFKYLDLRYNMQYKNSAKKYWTKYKRMIQKRKYEKHIWVKKLLKELESFKNTDPSAYTFVKNVTNDFKNNTVTKLDKQISDVIFTYNNKMYYLYLKIMTKDSSLNYDAGTDYQKLYRKWVLEFKKNLFSDIKSGNLSFEKKKNYLKIFKNNWYLFEYEEPHDIIQMIAKLKIPSYYNRNLKQFITRITNKGIHSSFGISPEGYIGILSNYEKYHLLYAIQNNSNDKIEYDFPSEYSFKERPLYLGGGIKLKLLNIFGFPFYIRGIYVITKYKLDFPLKMKDFAVFNNGNLSRVIIDYNHSKWENIRRENFIFLFPIFRFKKLVVFETGRAFEKQDMALKLDYKIISSDIVDPIIRNETVSIKKKHSYFTYSINLHLNNFFSLKISKLSDHFLFNLLIHYN